jgi:acyl-coenzyme A synthetase/AMP-(fatty) acid ligase/acyl carrier protein
VPDNATPIPIGKPIANAHVYILNEKRERVSIGVTGEIYIGGGGVSRGYLNQETLTDERFVADPFGSMPGKLYKSGDMGRWRSDGSIDFLGRNDSQVKIRGFRVELGEVEAALQQFSCVRQAVAVAPEEEPGVKRLVVYVVPDAAASEGIWKGSDDTEDDEAAGSFVQQLRACLKDKLPPHMAPTVIVLLKGLPLTPNGKVDRIKLPGLNGRRQLSRTYVVPSSSTERTLCDIWRQSLSLERVGVHDDFFELGGDSLVGIEMIAAVASTLEVELNFVVLFQCPTVRQLAHHVDELLTHDGTP